MGVGISQDVGGCPMLTEDVEYLLYGATLLGARIELAVRVGSCPTLAKAVVALGIDLLRLRDLRQVALPFMHILAALQHDGAQSELYQSQGSKQPTGACSHDDDGWPV